jgi:proline iminopeptidase
MMLDHTRFEVGGATLEGFTGGSRGPTICTSHPFEPMTAEPASAWPLDETVQFVGIHPRGIGGSSPVTGPRDVTLDQQIKDLEAVRQHMGIDRWVFLGRSGGAITGLLYALRHPSSMSGLILEYMGPSGRLIAEDRRSILSPENPQYEDFFVQLAAGAEFVRESSVLGTVDRRLQNTEWVRLRPDLWVLMRGTDALVMCPADDRRAWGTHEEFATGFDVLDQLSEIRVPTLIVAGRLDPLVPLEYVDMLHRAIRMSQFLVLAHTGHADVLEPEHSDRESYASAVRSFLATFST